MITGRCGWVLLVFAVLGISVALDAQSTEIARIGFLRAEAPDALLDAFQEGLREVNYVDGRNAVVEQRWANGYLDRLPGLTAELVQLKVDVIVTASTPAALAAKRATSTIPIVIASSGDPVAGGLVGSLAHPDGNVTGQTIMLEEVAIKRLELLKETVPSLSRVAVLWTASNPIYAPIVKDIEGAAPRIGVQVRIIGARPRRDRRCSSSYQGDPLRRPIRLRGSRLPQ
jgi:putative ABC transport system substrate-binding protein